MRVSGIPYGLNERKKAKLEESCEDEKWAQEKTVEIERLTRIKIGSRLGNRRPQKRIKSRKRIQIKKLWQKLRLT